MKIAEALILRKHLAQKVAQLEPLKQIGDNGMFEVQTQRVNINENTDEIKMQIPKVTLAEITKEYDKYSKALRELDTSIQEANWKTTIGYKPGKDLNI